MSAHLTILGEKFTNDLITHRHQTPWQLARVTSEFHNVTFITESPLEQSFVEQQNRHLTVFHQSKASTSRKSRWPWISQIAWWIRQLKQVQPTGWIWTSELSTACAVILTGRAKQLVYHPTQCLQAIHQLPTHYPQLTLPKVDYALRRLDRLAYQHAAQVIFSTKNLADQFQQHHGVHPHSQIIHSGIDLKQIAKLPSIWQARELLGMPAYGFTIGFVGHLNEFNDLSYLLKSLAYSNFLTAEDRLVIIGHGPSRKRLEKQIDHYHLRHHVTIINEADTELLHPAYATMDVFVNPSIYESSGQATRYAMALGLPIIARHSPINLNCLSDMIVPGETGLMMSPLNTNDMIGKIQELKNNPKWATTIGMAAKSATDNQSWETTISQHLQVLGLTLLAPSKKQRFLRKAA